MEKALVFIIIVTLIGLIVLSVYTILSIVYQQMYWKIKYPFYEEDIKPRYNLKDRIFLEIYPCLPKNEASF